MGGDGSLKKVQQIQKGDKVMCPNGETAVVECVWVRKCKEGKTKAVNLNGLHITPYHPIRDSKSRWNFPCSVQNTQNLECKEYFNFVLEKGHIMIINGIECCTLGHGFDEEIVKHSYWGTQKVIDDLKKMKGYQKGYIDFTSGKFVNDPITNIVVAMTG